MTNGGEAITSVLQAHGVDVVFGIPEGHILAVYGALARNETIRHVRGRHAQGLVYMADGYRRASGRIGVVLATSCPADVTLMGAAKAALQSILAGLGGGRSNHDEWILRCKQAYQDNIESRRQSHPMEMEFLDAFRSVLPHEAVVFFDRCNLGYWAWRCTEAYRPRTFHYPFGSGGLCGSLPQAIGANISCSDKTVVSVIGDGGFHFTGMDLIVAAIGPTTQARISMNVPRRSRTRGRPRSSLGRFPACNNP